MLATATWYGSTVHTLNNFEQLMCMAEMEGAETWGEEGDDYTGKSLYNGIHVFACVQFTP